MAIIPEPFKNEGRIGAIGRDKLACRYSVAQRTVPHESNVVTSILLDHNLPPVKKPGQSNRRENRGRHF